MMQEFRTKTTIAQDGQLSIKGLPFRKGETVEVIVLTQDLKPGAERYPLRGKPFKLHQPYKSVAEDEWEVLK
jgi:hypothetical protein